MGLGSQRIRALGLVGGVLWSSLAAAANDEGPAARQRPMALGLQLDLFPTVISAVNGELGYAPQVWLGIGHARVRLIGAHLEPPDALAFADDGFENPTTTSFAVTIDYTFGDHFDGVWLGGGFELWQRTIEHRDVAGTAALTSTVATFGGGYIWRLLVSLPRWHSQDVVAVRLRSLEPHDVCHVYCRTGVSQSTQRAAS